MRVVIDNYRNHWLSPYTILEKLIFWREIDYDEPLIVKWHDRLDPLCIGLKWLLDKVHPPVEKIWIDRNDTWSMDYTLALIIVPMLKQLKETKQGAPCVDDEDVPEELRSTSAPPVDKDTGDVDDNHFKRWEYALDEMIFAFECVADPMESWSDQFHKGEIDFMWEKLPDNSKLSTLKHGPNHTHQFDMDGYKVVNARIDNGLRMFGKYYRGLWD